jgi:site-specific recombinase XerD
MTDVIYRFKEELIREDKSPVTIRNYVNDVQLFARWIRETYGEDFQPGRIVQREIIEYRSFLITTRSASAATVNRRLASLTKFFSWCIAAGEAKINPAAGVKGIAITDSGPRSLDTSSLRRLLREVHARGSLRDIAILELLCGTAVRVGEMVSLTLEDLTISERKGSIRVRNGKGRSSREVPLNVDVRKAVNAWLGVRPQSVSRHLFIGQRGDYMTASGVWRIVKKYAAMAGVPELRVHDLRHTVLTRLVRECNCDLVTVARISGHRNLKTLMRYAEPSADDIAAAVEKLAFTS